MRHIVTPIIAGALKSIAWLKKRARSDTWLMDVYKRAKAQVEDASANEARFTDLYRHERMLADHDRNSAYQLAVAKYVKEGDIVVDLGTGTGILSFFAATRNPKRIYAIDHSAIIDVARTLAENAGITCIDFRRVNSRQFTSPEPVDVIVHEQIGQLLFDEIMISNLLDLRRRVLKAGGRILPNRFDLYVEPVSLREEYRVPFIWEQRINGLCYDALKTGVHSEADDEHRRRILHPYMLDCLLCDPQKLTSFDLETMEKEDVPTRYAYRKKAVRNGTVDGFCLYFVASFDEDISFSNSPLNRKTSWGIPMLRTESTNCREGDTIEFEITMGDVEILPTWNWSYKVIPGYER